jgi:outer membrane protein assembly factor BamB
MVLVFAVGSLSAAKDWPGFRGLDRDGKSGETGLLKVWPKKGPKLLWKVDGIGRGYSSPAIADGKIYVTGLDGSDGALTALSLKGKELWRVSYGKEWTRSMPGVRCTASVDEGRVHVISGLGRIACFDTDNGEEVWAVEAVKDFNGKYGMWGIAESPLIDGDNVICTPGGSEATVMALDKTTGRVVWKCAVDDQGNACCSPIAVQRGERRLIVTMLEDCTVGIDAETGELLWKDVHSEYQAKATAINPVSPLYHDGCIYTTSGYNDGSAMLQLNADGSAIERKWVETTLDCHHGGVVLVDGFIFGSNYHGVYDGAWACVDWETGKEMYHMRWNCKGSVIFADGLLYCYDERYGVVALVKPDPAGFEPTSAFQVPFGKGKHWAHPAISNGVLYIRHGDTLGAYNIKPKKGLFR